MAVSLRFNVYPISQKYANGLDAIELCLYREYESRLVKPRIGTPRDISFVTKEGTYKGRLITYPQTGEIYISPALYTDRSGEKTTLASVMNDLGIKPGQDVAITVEGSVFKLED
jgi:hypothetical protein